MNERWQDRRSIVVTTNLPDSDPDSAGAALRASAHSLRDTASSGRVSGRDLDELRRILERVERVATQVSEHELVGRLRPDRPDAPADRVATVSRLIEICDDPLPIMGEDLRMTAQGA